MATSQLLDMYGQPMSPAPTKDDLNPYAAFYLRLGQTISRLPNPDEVLRKAGVDVRAYFSILRHPHVFAVVESRRLSHLEREMIVRPADPTQGVAVERADYVRDEFKRLGNLDELRGQLWYGGWIGYATGLVDWEPHPEGGFRIERIRALPPQCVAFDVEGRPVLQLASGLKLMPPARCLVIRSAPYHGWDYYGNGCARPCYWPSLFLTWDMKFWAEDTEKFSAPKIYAILPSDWQLDTRGSQNEAKILKALEDWTRTGAAAFPGEEGLTINTLTTAAYSGALVHDKFESMLMDMVSKAVLGQTLTTDGGVIGSGAQAVAKVQAEMGLGPRIRADLKMLRGPLTDLALKMTYYRFGDGEFAPLVDFEGGAPTAEFIDKLINELGLPISKEDAYKMFDVPTPAEDAEPLPGRAQGQTALSPLALAEGGGSRPFSLTLADAREEAAREAEEQESYLRQVKADLADAYRELGDWHLGQLPGTGTARKVRLKKAPAKILNRVRDALALVVLRAYAVGRSRARRKIEERLSASLAEEVEFAWGVAAYGEVKRHLIEKTIVTPAEFRQLEGRLKASCFSIATVEDERVLELAQGMLGEVAAGEMAWSDFSDKLNSALRESGASPLTDFHIENVIRTNTASAYEAGRFVELTQTKAGRELFPVYRYRTVGDARVRYQHRKLEGTLIRADDPNLATYWPPLDYQCRCIPEALTAEDLAAEGLKAPEGNLKHDWVPTDGFDQAPGTHLGLVA